MDRYRAYITYQFIVIWTPRWKICFWRNWAKKKALMLMYGDWITKI